jgi:solute:Na+ symporter, SSS family
MGIIDIVVFFGFIAMVMVVGLWKSKSAHSEEGGAADYFLAGRGLKWWLIGISLIAANISAEQFVGMSGSAAGSLGLAIASYEWMAAVTLVVVAFCFLPSFLKTGIYTIPQFLEHRYNPLARSLMAFATMLILIGVSLAGVIYAGALPMCELFAQYNINISLTACCWLMGFFAAVYVAVGGLKACAWADLIQGTALVFGGAVITYLAFRALGLADVASLTPGVGETGVIPAIASIPEGGVARFFALNQDKLHMVMRADNPDIPWTALVLGLWIPNFYYWGLNQYITQRLLGSASLAEGQKGIVLAAALKLVIPFVIVFPGLIAFNLYTKDMVVSAGNSPKIQLSNQTALAEIGKSGSTAILVADTYWMNNPVNAEVAPKVLAHNASVEALLTVKNAGKKEGEKGYLKPEKKMLVGIQNDSALGHLIKNLLKPGSGLLGFVLAALLGAIVSSLAAVLNAASTIFTMDIYAKYINKEAQQKNLVTVGRICIGVFVVIGCALAPELNNPRFGGIFKFIQEFQGYVSTGILAAFIYGFINRTGAGVTGVVALLLNPICYEVLRRFTTFAFLDRMAICLVIVLAVMTVVGMVYRLPKPVEFHSNTHLDLTSSKGAKWAGIGVIITTAILYVIFF